MSHWAFDSVFYHIYPLGFCGAPARNDFSLPAVPRLEKILDWSGHMRDLGVTALYLGPVFESTAHGYDTADYYHVDRRLGDRQTLARVVSGLHQQGIRVILDGVFNHVGRNFWAFRDLQTYRENSAYRDWFQGLDFGRQSPYHDSFAYEGWNGCFDLVRLNLHNPAVKNHLLEAVALWVREFDIDGLRLDAADCVDMGFLRELSSFSRNLRPDFWLLGEIIHGDYRQWANSETLDSVTNYECYKGLYSSLVDKNYFEIAYALNRQFGEGGIYRQLPLYNFADNHDVNRVASTLQDPAHLYPLYCLLYTMPGVPSIYYGSEWGLEGSKKPGDDSPLRPRLDLGSAPQTGRQPELNQTLSRLAEIRRNSPALRHGNYHQLAVNSEQLAFARQTEGDYVVVALNAAENPAPLEVTVPGGAGRVLRDMLNPGESFPISNQGKVKIDPIWPHWARILSVQ